jgi:B12-binding domain/radical SAM domain protein
MTALPLCIRASRQNRNSIAAVLAVIEAELESGVVEPQWLRDPLDAPDHALLVYSFMTPQANAVRDEMAALRSARGTLPRAIAGGPHASGDPEGTLRMGFHWVVVGEAGAAFTDLLRAVAAGSAPPPGAIRMNPLDDLDQYDPWPPSGMLFAQVEITRGCPIGCTFCQTPSLLGRRPRHRSLASLERILRVSAETGHRFTRFVSPNAFAYGSSDGRTPNVPALAGLLRTARASGLEKVFLGTFPSEVRPESVTDEVLGIVCDACDNRNLSVGLQSGSESMLERLHRGHTVREGIEAVARIAHHGFVPRVDFIFGLPRESDEDRSRTCEVIEHITSHYGARVHAHTFTPLPGTPLANEAPTPIDARTRERIEAMRGRGQVSGHRTDGGELPHVRG